MICLLVYDNGKKWIFMLFIMLISSNYAVFLMFSLLIYQNRFHQADLIRKKWRGMFITFNILYGIALLLAFMPFSHIYCDNDKHRYPRHFLLIILIQYTFTLVTAAFYNSKDIIIEHETAVDELDQNELNCFRKQVKVFNIYNIIITCFELMLGSMGVSWMTSQDTALECSASGYLWIYITFWGNLFSTFHIVVIAL